MSGKVVNVRSVEPFDVYIGRRDRKYSFKESIWANPYVIGKDGSREEVVEKYRRYLLSNPSLLSHLEELRGEVLECWCAPEPCHGEVLLELADQILLVVPSQDGKRSYRVQYGEHEFCSCPDYQNRGTTCVHLYVAGIAHAKHRAARALATLGEDEDPVDATAVQRWLEERSGTASAAALS